MKIRELLVATFGRTNKKSKKIFDLLGKIGKSNLLNEESIEWGLEKAEDRLTVGEIVRLVNAINGNICLAEDRFLAMFAVMAVGFDTRVSFSDTRFLGMCKEESALWDKEYEQIGEDYKKIVAEKYLLGQRSEQIPFGGETISITFSRGESLFMRVRDGYIYLEHSNQFSASTDTSDYEGFFHEEKGYIKKIDEPIYKEFIQGEDPVRKTIYNGFETVNYHVF